MRQRGDAGQLRVFAGRDPVTGRKRWIAKTVHGGKRTAQREMANLIAEVDRGLATGTEATVNDLMERWIELVSPQLRGRRGRRGSGTGPGRPSPLGSPADPSTHAGHQDR